MLEIVNIWLASGIYQPDSGCTALAAGEFFILYKASVLALPSYTQELKFVAVIEFVFVRLVMEGLDGTELLV